MQGSCSQNGTAGVEVLRPRWRDRASRLTCPSPPLFVNELTRQKHDHLLRSLILMPFYQMSDMNNMLGVAMICCLPFWGRQTGNPGIVGQAQRVAQLRAHPKITIYSLLPFIFFYICRLCKGCLLVSFFPLPHTPAITLIVLSSRTASLTLCSIFSQHLPNSFHKFPFSPPYSLPPIVILQQPCSAVVGLAFRPIPSTRRVCQSSG
jgi:hypothetical protein